MSLYHQPTNVTRQTFFTKEKAGALFENNPPAGKICLF